MYDNFFLVLHTVLTNSNVGEGVWLDYVYQFMY